MRKDKLDKHVYKERLNILIKQKVKMLYGDEIAKEIKVRIQKELDIIDKKELYSSFMVLSQIVRKANEAGFVLEMRGTIGSLYIAYLLDIVETDPLEFNIPYQSFFEETKKRQLNIELDIASEFIQKISYQINQLVNSDVLIIKIREDKRLSKLEKLQRLTGVNCRDVKIDEEQLMNDFKVDNIKVSRYNNEYAKKLLKATSPSTSKELIKVLTLVHGTGVWENNMEDIVKDRYISINGIISSRDDLFTYLIDKGIKESEVYKITKLVSKGKVLKNTDEWKEYKELMQKNNIPKWYIEGCEKVKYLFPKSHVITKVLNDYRLNWYKTKYSYEYLLIKNKI